MTRQARSLGAKGAEAALAGIEVRLLFTGKKRTQVARGRQGVGRGATLPPPHAVKSDSRRMRPPQGIEHYALDSLGALAVIFAGQARRFSGECALYARGRHDESARISSEGRLSKLRNSRAGVTPGPAR